MLTPILPFETSSCNLFFGRLLLLLLHLPLPRRRNFHYTSVMAYLDINRTTIIRRLAARDSYADAQEVLETLKKSGFAEAEETADALVAEQLLFAEPGGGYTSRSGFFRGASALIRLTPMELERGILIPGHRFLPLYNLDIPPSFLNIRIEGKEPGKKPTTLRYQEALFYYRLFGTQKMMALLVMEDTDIDPLLMDEESYPDSSFTIDALDMGRWYREWGAEEGFCLKATLSDWNSGAFTLEPATAPRDDRAARAWIERLEGAFLDMWDERPWPLPPDEELARAFHRAGREILEDPPLHIGGFLAESRRVKVVDLDDRSFIWDIERGWDEESESRAGRIPGLLASNRLEELLDKNHITVPLPYARACIRNSISSGLDYQSFLGTVLAGNDLQHIDEKAWKEIMRELMKLYDREEAAFRPGKEDPRFTELRRMAVFHYSGLAEILRELEHQRGPQAPDAYLMESLAARILTLVPLFDFLETLQEQERTIGAETFSQMEHVLEEIVEQCRAIVSKIDDNVMKGVMAARRERRDTAGSAPSYLVLEAVLTKTKPPIRRLLRLPSTMSLNDLHTVLQTAFGWENRHLHEFRIEGTRYFDPEEDPERAAMHDGRPEESLALADLEKASSFEYLYDFGDNWVHRITVKQILTPDEVPHDERGRAVCLGGERSAPPEDCGGIHSFDDLLLARATPASWRTEEQHAAVTWCPDWEPDIVDLDAINELLEEL